MTRAKPPFRADHVGSFLRPAALKEARAKHEKGAMSAAELKAVEKRYPGIDRVICATPLGTPLDVQLEDLDRFAKEVMPAFRSAKVAAAAE